MASGFSALAASRVDGATSRTVEAMFVFRRSPSSLVRPQIPVGVGVVELAGHHIITVVVQFQRVLPVRYEDDIRIVVLPELAGHA